VFGETLSMEDWIGGLLIVGSGVVLVFMVPSADEKTSQH
jgi:drug/metabolite transporter (DMT)-like permease